MELVLKVGYIYVLWKNMANFVPVSISFIAYDEIIRNILSSIHMIVQLYIYLYCNGTRMQSVLNVFTLGEYIMYGKILPILFPEDSS